MREFHGFRWEIGPDPSSNTAFWGSNSPHSPTCPADVVDDVGGVESFCLEGEEGRGILQHDRGQVGRPLPPPVGGVVELEVELVADFSVAVKFADAKCRPKGDAKIRI